PSKMFALAGEGSRIGVEQAISLWRRTASRAPVPACRRRVLGSRPLRGRRWSRWSAYGGCTGDRLCQGFFPARSRKGLMIMPADKMMRADFQDPTSKLKVLACAQLHQADLP